MLCNCTLNLSPKVDHLNSHYHVEAIPQVFVAIVEDQ